MLLLLRFAVQALALAPKTHRHCFQDLLDDFETLDLDRDGSLSKAELLAAARRAGGEHQDSLFSGDYEDAKHPGCPRSISVSTDTLATVSGTDEAGLPWAVSAQTSGKRIQANFSSKGGPAALSGNWTGKGIEWSDGNTWLARHGLAPGCQEGSTASGAPTAPLSPIAANTSAKVEVVPSLRV